MTAQSGKDIVVSFKDGTGTYQILAGLRNRGIRLNAEAVDITNADSVGSWRELLDVAGVHTATMTGDGVAVDEAADGALIAAHIGGNVRDGKILVPAIGTFEGKFKVTAYELAGVFNKEVTRTLTLESAGQIVFTAI